ncbi:hypothetical protein BGW36DRAFT_359946 [Talaromyces proteolyticus]|uniref:Life-span regulatory factor-domain-containing protein n=1 Tax=Talaromyces proteolyticus TaxID=1131652 RepID=A0AAD4KMI0_9EURO|nr:uncharacterized protein BGW36DRAFT_359946 [Talaromyces proteolyticus]KAH8696088.1 hypothetical protein BGW36DRAFT_359946 [Talaromyces proteolyticus]
MQQHRRQNPHSRGQYNSTTSPPSRSTVSTAAKPASNAKKGPSVRSQRPVLYHRKSASAQLPLHPHSHHPHNHHSHNHNHSHHHKSSLPKLLGPGSGPANWTGQHDDDKPEMATSFLQYCAMCEKQITVPCNSVLYCSESCRRKDSRKPLSASSYTYTTLPSSTPPDSPPMSPRAIVTPLTPTGSSLPASLSRIPSDLHDAKSDLDPTEWKPVIGTTNSSTSLSDAWTYLSQFHRDESWATLQQRRSLAHTHRSSASLSMLGMAPPSLINTPSTVASSATSSSSSDYIGAYYAHELSGGAGATRPLPPRHNPSFSGATKGVELVVPHIVTAAPAVPLALGSSLEHDADAGVWLKPHRRRSLKPATPSSIASGVAH